MSYDMKLEDVDITDSERSTLESFRDDGTAARAAEKVRDLCIVLEQFHSGVRLDAIVDFAIDKIEEQRRSPR